MKYILTLAAFVAVAFSPVLAFAEMPAVESAETLEEGAEKAQDIAVETESAVEAASGGDDHADENNDEAHDDNHSDDDHEEEESQDEHDDEEAH